ncbi:MAG: DUF1489 domain-containing protein [Methylobacteriaceae bacterium]|nr:DUF1489 domain-containing protein [Methylobacteriaceae bacterium]
MTLHLIKLCVGIDTVAELEDWIAEKRRRERRTRPEHIHTTRMTPKRQDELLAGGSLYWVIKGMVSCRQRLLALRPVTDGEGTARCQIVLEPAVVPVSPRPCGPFQGWRYLRGADAPADLGAAGEAVALMPDAMRRELAALGLL